MSKCAVSLGESKGYVAGYRWKVGLVGVGLGNREDQSQTAKFSWCHARKLVLELEHVSESPAFLY